MCNKHPKYKAIRRPTKGCPQCFVECAKKHPDEPLTMKDFAYLMEQIGVVERQARSASSGVQTAIDVANGRYSPYYGLA